MFKKNLFSSILILILLGGNIYLSTQYFSIGKQLQQIKNQKLVDVNSGVKPAEILTEFLDVVLATRTTNPDSRLKLENDIRQLGDPAITKEWDALVASKDTKISQSKAIKIIGLLEDKIK